MSSPFCVGQKVTYLPNDEFVRIVKDDTHFEEALLWGDQIFIWPETKVTFRNCVVHNTITNHGPDIERIGSLFKGQEFNHVQNIDPESLLTQAEFETYRARLQGTVFPPCSDPIPENSLFDRYERKLPAGTKMSVDGPHETLLVSGKQTYTKVYLAAEKIIIAPNSKLILSDCFTDAEIIVIEQGKLKSVFSTHPKERQEPLDNYKSQEDLADFNLRARECAILWSKISALRDQYNLDEPVQDIGYFSSFFNV